MAENSGHWDKELFRREGHRMVDWIAEYLDGGNREHPVLSRVEPGEVSSGSGPGSSRSTVGLFETGPSRPTSSR